MGRKNKRQSVQVADLPALMGPTPEQLLKADFERGEVMHVESFTRATAHRVRQASSLLALLDRGQITDAQYFAALQVATVAERIERAVAVRCASLEARVDNSGSGRAVLVELLGAVRLERAYSEWRNRLPMPRRMVIDMVIEDRALKATARVYGMGWPRAMARLRDALDLWNEQLERAVREIDQEDLDRAQERACA